MVRPRLGATEGGKFQRVRAEPGLSPDSQERYGREEIKNGKKIKGETLAVNLSPEQTLKNLCLKQGSPDPGSCWVVQPGSEGEPNGFRGLTGSLRTRKFLLRG